MNLGPLNIQTDVNCCRHLHVSGLVHDLHSYNNVQQ